jgi:thiol-disulfide isomerase/thioredoxin
LPPVSFQIDLQRSAFVLRRQPSTKQRHFIAIPTQKLADSRLWSGKSDRILKKSAAYAGHFRDNLCVLFQTRPLFPKWRNVLWKQYVETPEVKRLLPLLAFSGEEASGKFVRAVLEKNPNRLTQARAAQALAGAYERFAAFANELKNDKESRKANELESGEEAVEKAIVRGENAQADLKKLHTLIEEKYFDIIPCLGKVAPDLNCQDIDGKKVKLSGLKGKVVVLDIWATWCVPCKAMIPHQREIVGKLKDKPFAFVSVSIDDNREILTKFLEKEPMPWTHWWTGKESGFMEDWGIAYVPTIYVIDARGVIRHRDQNGRFPPEQLAAAVNALLEEIE